MTRFRSLTVDFGDEIGDAAAAISSRLLDAEIPMTVGRSFLRALIFASLVVGGCDREPFESSVRQALQTLGHRLTFFAVPKSGWTVAATIERRSEWHGMADPRLHGESAGY